MWMLGQTPIVLTQKLCLGFNGSLSQLPLENPYRIFFITSLTGTEKANFGKGSLKKDNM